MDNIKLDGQLEIDRNRGVIYFHSSEGYSALRICGIKEHMQDVKERPQIDITLSDGTVNDSHEDLVAISICNLEVLEPKNALTVKTMLQKYASDFKIAWENLTVFWTEEANEGLLNDILEDNYPFDKSFDELYFEVEQWTSEAINKSETAL